MHIRSTVSSEFTYIYGPIVLPSPFERLVEIFFDGLFLFFGSRPFCAEPVSRLLADPACSLMSEIKRAVIVTGDDDFPVFFRQVQLVELVDVVPVCRAD